MTNKTDKSKQVLYPGVILCGEHIIMERKFEMNPLATTPPASNRVIYTRKTKVVTTRTPKNKTA